ncbi:MAG: hypothetical protein IJS99_00445 [Synergistaceae bacterium]|nr:hypothetical protein [Synergistaceae bacterium]
MSQYALSTVKLANFCESLDVKFFYVSLPHKICVSQDKDVSGTLDFSNQNADKFFAVLKDSGVKYYDLRKNLHDQGMNHHEAFFITDHHWRPESGLWAAREILKFLREDYNWPVKPEILNPENFDYVIYHDWFLGSHGKKLTLARTKLENITMIYPKFDTYLNYEIPNLNINLSGDFSIMYDMSCITKRDYYNLSAYGAYNYGGQSLIRFTNLLAASNRKILVIDDSFGNCVLPFLALGVKNVAEIDLRGFNGSLKNYIASERPDLVIVMYYINHLGGAKFFDFR